MHMLMHLRMHAFATVRMHMSHGASTELCTLMRQPLQDYKYVRCFVRLLASMLVKCPESHLVSHLSLFYTAALVSSFPLLSMQLQMWTLAWKMLSLRMQQHFVSSTSTLWKQPMNVAHVADRDPRYGARLATVIGEGSRGLAGTIALLGGGGGGASTNTLPCSRPSWVLQAKLADRLAPFAPGCHASSKAAAAAAARTSQMFDATLLADW